MPARRAWLTLQRGCRLPVAAALLFCLTPAGAASEAIRSYHDALRLARDGRYDAALEALKRAQQQDPTFPRTYPRIVSVCRQLQAPDKAREYFESLSAGPSTAAYASYGLGLFNLQQRQHAEAERYFKRAIELAPEFAPPYTRLAALAIERGQVPALSEYVRTLLQANSRNAAAHYALGYVQLQQGNRMAALEHLQAAGAIAPDLWEILDARYFSYFHSDRLPEAFGILEMMLSKAEQTGHLEWKSHVLGRMGMINYDLANYSAAIVRLREAIGITRDLGDRVAEQAFQGHLGMVYFNMARYREALTESQEAIALARRSADRVGEGRNLGNVANIHAELGNYQQAIDAFRLAIKLARDAGDRANEADQLASLALAYSKVGYHDRALANLQTAVTIARATKNPWLEGRFLEATGDVYRNLARYPQALRAYDEALAVAQPIGDRFGEASRLASAGEVCAKLGKDAACLGRFTRALAISRETGATLVEGRILNTLGSLKLRLGRPAEALDLHRQALAIGSAARMPEVVWRAHAGIAAAAEREGQHTAAVAAYRDAIISVEQLRSNLRIAEEKAGFLEDKIEVYQNLISLLIRLHAKQPGAGHLAEAFHYAERARARSALDLMAEAETRIDSGIDTALSDRQRELHRRIARLQSQLIQQHADKSRDPSKKAAVVAAIEAADEEHRALRRQLHETNPRYADFRYPEPANLADTKELLSERAVLLEYVAGADASYLLAVTRDDQLVARLPGALSLAPRIRKLRDSIAAPPSRATLSTYWLTAQSLYRDLIAPASRLLAGREEVIISADGILHYLPFAALLKPSREVPADIDPARLPYLIRDYAISYVPSASVLTTVRRYRASIATPEKTLLAFADPEYGAGPAGKVRSSLAGTSFGKLARLPHSRLEAHGIAKLHPPDKTDVFAGGRATEDNLKSHPIGRYRYVHFAAHGLLDESNPQFSGLFLSRPESGSSEQEDGVLQSYEIFNLKLNADLVVLSACETGLGKEVRGEGLVGLTQAFLYAGSSAVAVSLWNVADRSTADLMIRFYRHLRERDSRLATSRSAASEAPGAAITANDTTRPRSAAPGSNRPTPSYAAARRGQAQGAPPAAIERTLSQAAGRRAAGGSQGVAPAADGTPSPRSAAPTTDEPTPSHAAARPGAGPSKGPANTPTWTKAAALRRAQLELIASRSFAHPYYWAPFAIIGDSR